MKWLLSHLSSYFVASVFQFFKFLKNSLFPISLPFSLVPTYNVYAMNMLPSARHKLLLISYLYFGIESNCFLQVTTYVRFGHQVSISDLYFGMKRDRLLGNKSYYISRKCKEI
jgi:hypothetical protein